jgi:hypothetical protein
MVVVANAEPLLDQVADHRPSPYPGLVASLHRSELNDDRQRLPLFGGELGGGPLRDLGSQALDVIGVVPLEPTIDRAPGDPTFTSDGGHLPTSDVRSDCASSAPLPEVVLQLRFEDELVELLQLHATTT